MGTLLFSRNRILNLILALVIMAEFFLMHACKVCSGEADAAGQIRDIIERTIDAVNSYDDIAANAGTSEVDWFVFAVGRYADTYSTGDYSAYLTDYCNSLQHYVEDKYRNSGNKLSRSKATEWHRISLTALACGGNPEDFGADGDGGRINLIADGTYGCVAGNPWKQGINGAVFALISMDAGNYTVPEDAPYTREKIIDYILSKELSSGGFALSGKKCDIDVTAMCVQALSAYYDVRDDVKDVVDRAVACLSEGFGGNAGYGDSESAAQVLIALTCCGIDARADDRFITSEGKNLIDCVMSYYNEEKSMFSHVAGKDADLMATSQCLCSLAGWLRYEKGCGRLYDFVGDIQKPDITCKPVATGNPTATRKPAPTETPDNVQAGDGYNAAPVEMPDNMIHDTDVVKKPKDTGEMQNSAKADKLNNSNAATKRTVKKNEAEHGMPGRRQHADEHTGVSVRPLAHGKNDTDIIFERDYAYVNSYELEKIAGSRRNIMIKSTYDGGRCYCVTINGMDIGECVYMDMSVVKGSEADGSICAIAEDAYTFTAGKKDGVMCDALYSVDTGMSDGEYLLMRYTGKNAAEYVNKVTVSNGIMDAVIGSPGMYYICKSVRTGKESAGGIAGAIDSDGMIEEMGKDRNDSGKGGGMPVSALILMTAAVMAVAAVAVLVMKKGGRLKKMINVLCVALLAAGAMSCLSCAGPYGNGQGRLDGGVQEEQYGHTENNGQYADSGDGTFSVDMADGTDIDYDKYSVNSGEDNASQDVTEDVKADEKRDSGKNETGGKELDDKTAADSRKTGSHVTGSDKTEDKSREDNATGSNAPGKSSNSAAKKTQGNNASGNNKTGSNKTGNNSVSGDSGSGNSPSGSGQDIPAPVEPEDAVIDREKSHTCSLYIECKTIFDNLDKLDGAKKEILPEDGIILDKKNVIFYEGESVFDIMLRETRNGKIHMEYSYTPVYNSSYIEGIANIYEFDCGELSGWIYQINDGTPNYGASRYQLKDGDKIHIRYTCDLGKDVGFNPEE